MRFIFVEGYYTFLYNFIFKYNSFNYLKTIFHTNIKKKKVERDIHHKINNALNIICDQYFVVIFYFSE